MTHQASFNQPEHLIIGKIVAPWGIHGEVKVEILTDFPDRFTLLAQVYLGDEHKPYKLEGFRKYKQWALLKFAGLDTRAAVEALRNLLVKIPISEAMPLKDGEYYEHQIIGLEAWTTEGQYLGRVVEIIYTGSNDVYVVQNEGKELLIPALKDVVPKISLEEGHLIVCPIAGLF